MKENIKSTLKSNDTEEWLDTVWTRPIGYVWARFFNAFNIHPNTVTVLSMIIGAASGYFFAQPSFQYGGTHGFIMNIIAMLMLAWANFYDSADGQLARMTGKKTQLGRILDGAAGDVWFVVIYTSLAVRFYFNHSIEFGWLGIEDTPTSSLIGAIAFWGVCWYSGVICHGKQCGLSDYYRNIHLFFLKGKAGSELDNSVQQRALYDQTPWKGNLLWKAFLFTYVNYTKSQEKQTPQFQSLMETLKNKYGNVENIPEDFKKSFRENSLPMMKWANILTFNTRAIALYIACLVDFPWIYLLFEIIIMTSLYYYMRHTHESFCKRMNEELKNKE